MYRVMADIFGVSVFEVRLGPDFSFEAAEFIERVPAQVKVLFLCSPNNPTGNLLDREEILFLASRWDRIIVLDEAYIEFSAGASLIDTISEHRNLIIMRTFSKAFGGAGFRLGYSVASPEIIDYFLKVKAPYNLSSLTMAEGVRTLKDVTTTRNEIDQIITERSRMERELAGMPGIQSVLPSQANFVLFRCEHAPEVCRKLLERQIVVRDRSRLPGLENCIRVSVGTPEENSVFLEALRSCQEESNP
jgi:histidinol-phosphate aminotransferase